MNGASALVSRRGEIAALSREDTMRSLHPKVGTVLAP